MPVYHAPFIVLDDVESEIDSESSVDSIIESPVNSESDVISDTDDDVVPPPSFIFFNGFNGPVYAIQPTSDGAYVSGRFTAYSNGSGSWLPCNGIAKIKLDGSLDTTFATGAGFDISEPYYAPTGVQLAADGGVFVGMCYIYLKEKELHTTTNEYAAMKWQGVRVPPVIKLKPDGTRDTTFETDFLLDATTGRPLFSKFHMYEQIGNYYYVYNVETEVDDPSGINTIATQEYACADCRASDGTLKAKVLFGASSADPMDILVHHAIGKVFITHTFPFASTTKWRVTPTGTSNFENLCPLDDGLSISAFNLTLQYDPAFAWKQETVIPVDDEYGSDWPARVLAFGCETNGLFAGYDVYAGFGTGKYAGSGDNQHKGLIYINGNQTLDPSQNTATHFASGASVYTGSFNLSDPDNGWIVFYQSYGDTATIDVSRETFGAFIDTMSAPDRVVTVSSSGFSTGVMDFTITPGSSDTHWEATFIEHGYYKVTAGSFALWDLTGADANSSGFEAFDTSGDTDPENIMYPLWNHPPGGPITIESGVYVTGPIATFKGVALHAQPGYGLVKILPNGNKSSTFPYLRPGPDASSVRSKIMCAALSSDGRTLYVGGRFTDVNGVARNYITSVATKSGNLFPT
jgi:hypothetical protein